ncbi:MAG: HAD family hydrolase [Deltaproteobacteria bacterium]|nr:HAD family hydrolase [Deltaproteobacteria bacterium]
MNSKDTNHNRSIFFDLDGTLTDPREGIVRCIAHALEQLGRKSPAEHVLERYIGPPLYESFAALLDTKELGLVNRAVELYRERFALKGMYENTLYSGIIDALNDLQQQKAQLYVVTSKPTVFAVPIVEHFGLQQFFQQVYGSELDGTRVNKTELISWVLEKERIPPSNAVMVGDREHDIKGALANGVRPIGVLWGYGSREELLRAGAVKLVTTPVSLAMHIA